MSQKKMEFDTTLPLAFDADAEPNKTLAKVKASVSKKFSWTKSQPLFDAVHLAMLLVVFGKEDEAHEICRALGRIAFDGSFRLWAAVEMALMLQARLALQRGQPAEAEDCVRRVRAAGYVDDRLAGSMLDPNHALEVALEEGDKKYEQAARLRRALELAFIIGLGGSQQFTVAQAEQDWSENMARLKELTGAN